MAVSLLHLYKPAKLETPQQTILVALAKTNKTLSLTSYTVLWQHCNCLSWHPSSRHSSCWRLSWTKLPGHPIHSWHRSSCRPSRTTTRFVDWIHQPVTIVGEVFTSTYCNTGQISHLGPPTNTPTPILHIWRWSDSYQGSLWLCSCVKWHNFGWVRRSGWRFWPTIFSSQKLQTLSHPLTYLSPMPIL